MSEPTAINRAERRKAKEPKPAATLHDLKFRLRLMSRKEQQQSDGWIYAQSYFNVIGPTGQVLCEETPDGPVPLVIATVPQPIKQALIATGSRLVARA